MCVLYTDQLRQEYMLQAQALSEVLQYFFNYLHKFCLSIKSSTSKRHSTFIFVKNRVVLWNVRPLKAGFCDFYEWITSQPNIYLQFCASTVVQIFKTLALVSKSNAIGMEYKYKHFKRSSARKHNQALSEKLLRALLNTSTKILDPFLVDISTNGAIYLTKWLGKKKALYSSELLSCQQVYKNNAAKRVQNVRITLSYCTLLG